MNSQNNLNYDAFGKHCIFGIVFGFIRNAVFVIVVTTAESLVKCGTRGRNRTGTPIKAGDFKSRGIINKINILGCIFRLF